MRERFWAGSRHFQTHTLPCTSCVHHHRLRAAAHWVCKTARVGSPWTPGWKTSWNTDKILGNRCYQMHVPVPDAVWSQTNWSITDWSYPRTFVLLCVYTTFVLLCVYTQVHTCAAVMYLVWRTWELVIPQLLSCGLTPLTPLTAGMLTCRRADLWVPTCYGRVVTYVLSIWKYI